MSPQTKRRKGKRSKDGCWRCKERRVKCDTTHPICSACERLGLNCQYGIKLLWRDDAEKRGISFGRKQFWNKKLGKKDNEPTGVEPETFFIGIKRNDYEFLNFSNNDLLSANKHHYSFTSNNFMPSPSLSSSSSNGNELSPTTLTLFKEPSIIGPLEYGTEYDDYLFQYYSEVICSNCTIYDDSSNGFRFVIVPMAVSCPSLMHTLLSVSATMLAKLNDSFQEVLEHERNALYDHLEFIIDNDNSTSASLEVLATVLMLLIFELKNCCYPDWFNHINTAVDYLNKKSANDGSESDLTFFVKKYLVYQLTNSSTVNFKSIIMDGLNGKLESFWTEQTLNSKEIDGHIGSSTELLGLVAQIVKTSFKVNQGDAEISSSLTVNALELESKLMNLEQFSSHISITITTDSILHDVDAYLFTDIIFMNDDQANQARKSLILMLTAESRRLASLIYLYSTLFDMHYTNLTIQDLAHRVIEYIEKIQDLDTTSIPKWGMSSLIWPLFMAGYHVDSDSDRIDIMRICDYLQVKNTLGHVVKAREILEVVWKHRDLTDGKNGNKSDFGKMEMFISPITSAISLG